MCTPKRFQVREDSLEGFENGMRTVWPSAAIAHLHHLSSLAELCRMPILAATVREQPANDPLCRRPDSWAFYLSSGPLTRVMAATDSHLAPLALSRSTTTYSGHTSQYSFCLYCLATTATALSSPSHVLDNVNPIHLCALLPRVMPFHSNHALFHEAGSASPRIDLALVRYLPSR